MPAIALLKERGSDLENVVERLQIIEGAVMGIEGKRYEAAEAERKRKERNLGR